MTARIYRYQVPVRGEAHTVELNGYPHYVGCHDREYVEFWAIHRDGEPLQRRQFTVVGTGQPLPPEPYRIWGTAAVPGEVLVWHLVEVTP